jgi:hypothetical protein
MGRAADIHAVRVGGLVPSDGPGAQRPLEATRNEVVQPTRGRGEETNWVMIDVNGKFYKWGRHDE